MLLVGNFFVTFDGESMIIPGDYLRPMGRSLAAGKPADWGCLLAIWPAGADAPVACEGEPALVEADASGRVSLPAHLLGGDARELVLCGAGDHLDLWERQAWEDFVGSFSSDDLLEFAKEAALNAEPAPEPAEEEDVLGEDVRRALERVRDVRTYENLHWRPGEK